MKAKFSLLAYVSGQRLTVPIHIKTGAATMPTGATRFYVRYTDENGKRHDDPLGADFIHALTQVRSLQARTDYERTTGEKLPAPPEAPSKTLAEEIKDWLDLKAITPGTAPMTVRTYRKSMDQLLDFVRVQNGKPHPIRCARDLTREDLFRFSAYLRHERKPSGEPRFKPLSVYSHFANAIIFLKSQNIHLAIPKKQWGKPTPRKAQMYTDEQLAALFFHSTPEECLIFKSFLYSGLRNQELAHLTYGDINFKTSAWTVEAKADWETKSEDSVRIVPVPPFHTEDILARMREKGAGPGDLIFPNSKGLAHKNYMQLLTKIARKAKVTGRVDIHKFRSTCATMWLRDGVDVMAVAGRLGHGNLQTIRQYIEALNNESQETMERTTKTFERFDTMRS